MHFLKSRQRYVQPLPGNDLETNNETICAARQQILNKQVYEAVTE
jgi:hypothetical protein